MKYDNLDEYDVEEQAVDDLDNIDDITGSEEKEDIPTPSGDDDLKKRQFSPKRVKIAVVVIIVLLVLGLIISVSISYFTNKQKSIVPVTTEKVNPNVVSDSDLVGKDDKIELVKETKTEDILASTDEPISFSSDDVKSSDGDAVNKFINNKGADVNSDNYNNQGYNSYNDGNIPNNVNVKSKRSISFSVHNNSNGDSNSDSSNNSGSNVNNDSIINDKKSSLEPSVVIANAPKDPKLRDDYYLQFLTTTDKINLYNEGITPEEYYFKYIAGNLRNNDPRVSITSNDLGNASNNNNNSERNDWRSQQSGIRLVSSFDKYDIKEGSYIPITISTVINTDEPGMFQAIVREDVYDSLNHRYTLIPMGSRLIGTYSGLSNNDASKVEMQVHRIILPNGKSLHLSNFSISDLQGVKGGKGYKDNKYFERILKAGLSVVLNLGSDFLNNASIGLKGFSLGGSNYDYNFNELKLPNENNGNGTPKGNNTNGLSIGHKEDLRGNEIYILDESYGVLMPKENVREAISIINNSKLDPIYKKALFKNMEDYAANVSRVYPNISRESIFGDFLGGWVANLIYDKLNKSINGKNNTDGNNGNANTVLPSGTSKELEDLVNSLGGKYGLNTGSNGVSNPRGLSSLSSLTGGNTSDLLALLRQKEDSDRDAIRGKLGTNNIIKNVNSTYQQMVAAWNSVTPTIHIEMGTRLNLYVSQDLSLEPYVRNSNR